MLVKSGTVKRMIAEMAYGSAILFSHGLAFAPGFANLSSTYPIATSEIASKIFDTNIMVPTIAAFT